MGTKLKDIVQVNITRENARLSRVGFGTPLLLGEHFHYEERVRAYSDPSEMIEDGFLTTDALYKAALALMAQQLSPTQFKIGRKLADVNEMQKIAFTGTPTAGTWTVTLDAVESGAIQYNADAAAVETALEAMSNITSVTVTGDMTNGFTIEFDGADANTAFNTFTVDISSLTGVTAATVTVLQEGSAVETWADALTNVRGYDDDWYAMAIMSRADADIEAIADEVEAIDNKLFFAASAEADIIASGSSDIASVLKGKSYDQTSVFYLSNAATQYPDAAWPGGQLPKDPGSLTWKFKELKSVTPDTSLSTTQVNNLKSKNANYYETLAGRNLVSGEGVVASGEYIDIIRGTAWLGQRIMEDVFGLLAKVDKVPFTTQGIESVGSVIKARLKDGVKKGLLAKDTIVINLPDIDSIDPSEKAARYLNNITFSANYAGAIHKVGIAGKLSV